MKNFVLLISLFVVVSTRAQELVTSDSLNPNTIVEESAGETSETPRKNDESSNNAPLDIVDEPAAPVYGQESFQLYLARNTTYPMLAMMNGIQGQVVYQFVVDTTGRINNVVILKDIGGGCGDMVKRTIENYPDAWIPGKNDGKKVATYYTGTFSFTLDESSPPKKQKRKKNK